jgi:hypothetical protein
MNIHKWVDTDRSGVNIVTGWMLEPYDNIPS